MTTTERDESTVTITGVAPGAIVALKRAAAIAAAHGHNWIGVEDLLAALLAETLSPLQVQWDQRGLGRLNYTELQDLVQSIVPGASNGSHGPAELAAVAYEVSGPHGEEFRGMIEGSTQDR